MHVTENDEPRTAAALKPILLYPCEMAVLFPAPSGLTANILVAETSVSTLKTSPAVSTITKVYVKPTLGAGKSICWVSLVSAGTVNIVPDSAAVRAVQISPAAPRSVSASTAAAAPVNVVPPPHLISLFKFSINAWTLAKPILLVPIVYNPPFIIMSKNMGEFLIRK